MKRLANQAFSLTEVVLALGIVSFALVSMLGLMGVGIDSSRRALDDTAIPAMSSRILAEVRARGAVVRSDYYFDGNGLPLDGPEAAVYKCRVAVRSVSPGELSDVAPDLSKVSLTFSRPASAVRPIHTEVVHATVFP